ncbi:hypothetical protein AGMMS49921_01660 [Endomicrobiia bacterium]|nr:hypothetical protein AGMMS49921_01660 [Endomicrobiia bacterium]
MRLLAAALLPPLPLTLWHDLLAQVLLDLPALYQLAVALAPSPRRQHYLVVLQSMVTLVVYYCLIVMMKKTMTLLSQFQIQLHLLT